MKNDELLYTARCSECGSVVCAATPNAMQREPQMATEWLRDGLNIERAKNAMECKPHAAMCSIGLKELAGTR